MVLEFWFSEFFLSHLQSKLFPVTQHPLEVTDYILVELALPVATIYYGFKVFYLKKP